MASVRIESEAFADDRYVELAELAGLADADHARGVMARIWRQCTIEQTHVLSESTVRRVIGARGCDAVDALVGARLGERTIDGVRIKGSKGRIEWLKKLRNNGKYGKLGGRPKKPTRVSQSEPKRPANGFENKTPLALALALAPSGSEKKTNGADPMSADLGVRRKVEMARLEGVHAARYQATASALGADVRPLNLTGQGERDLLECLRSRDGKGGLDAAVADCDRALAQRERQALQLRTVRFFGPGMWESGEFATAIGWTEEDIEKMGKGKTRGMTSTAKPAEFVKLT